MHSTYSNRAELLLYTTPGKFLFKSSSTGYKIGRRKCTPHLHPLAHEIESAPPHLKSSYIFIAMGWEKACELNSMPQSIYVLI